MSSEASALWSSLTSTVFSSVDDEFVAGFRRPGGANNRLAAWDPFDKTMRYYKFMLFNAAQQEPEIFFDHYRALGNVSIGDPISVRIRGCNINIDYLFAVDEAMFLASHLGNTDLKTIVEIGAGFGRTCHTLLALRPEIERYTIVDLPNVLALSQRVLKKVLPDKFDKILFVDATDPRRWQGLGADLVLNIDSFQEMPPATIDGYFKGIVEPSRYFYVKNPIGKYRPESIGLEVADPKRFHDVFSLGHCRDFVDPFDDESLVAARQKYLAAYRPANAELIGDQPMTMFPYLHHALYKLPRT